MRPMKIVNEGFVATLAALAVAALIPSCSQAELFTIMASGPITGSHPDVESWFPVGSAVSVSYTFDSSLAVDSWPSLTDRGVYNKSLVSASFSHSTWSYSVHDPLGIQYSSTSVFNDSFMLGSQSDFVWVDAGIYPAPSPNPFESGDLYLKSFSLDLRDNTSTALSDISFPTADDFDGSSYNWRRINVRFTRISTGEDSVASFYVDNVTTSVIPEPASILMLGLASGGFFFARRLFMM